VQELLSILIAAAVFGLLRVIRVKVFQFRSADLGGHFSLRASLRQMLRVLSSLLVPGLGQSMRGSMTVAFWHLGVLIVAFIFVGEVAFFLNLAYAMESAFT
jgi:hypothetical protein